MLIRYPGSKAKLAKRLLSYFPGRARPGLDLWASSNWEYREPFFGAGAIGLHILEWIASSNSRVPAWLNDIDLWLIRLWASVLDVPGELCDEIRAFTPSPEAFYEFKAQDGRKDVEEVTSGFRKLALHQMSYSGLGAKAGGPLGGKNQAGAEYQVDCRWNPVQLEKRIWWCHDVLKATRPKLTAKDFEPMIRSAPRNAVIYLDPPYYLRGPELYAHSMSDRDHVRLRDACFACEATWIVSYDEHPRIRELWAGCRFQSAISTYTIGPCRNRKNAELIILNPL